MILVLLEIVLSIHLFYVDCQRLNRKCVKGNVDGHFHIWDLDRFEYSWPPKENIPLYRNFDPEQLKEEMEKTNVKYAVFIQVLNNSTREIEWVTNLAKEHKFIKGIVGGLDLTSQYLDNQLADLKQTNPLFKGCRHILAFEDRLDWILRTDVFNGLQLLEKYGLTFDLLVVPGHLPLLPGLIARLPKLKFVVDHIAKPLVKDQIFQPWMNDIANLKQFPNVHIKLSGFVNEGNLTNWKREDFQPYFDHVLSTFGPDRCFFGSDWPVSKQAGADYIDVYNLLIDLLDNFDRFKLTHKDRRKIFRENVIDFYNLDLS